MGGERGKDRCGDSGEVHVKGQEHGKDRNSAGAGAGERQRRRPRKRTKTKGK